MNWYLRKSDGAIYGPVDDASLRRWAAEGRIEPEDRISTDRQTWSPASDHPNLEMDWLIEMEDGSFYGPLHLAALRELAEDGSLTLKTRLIHKTTGDSRTFGEALAAPEAPDSRPNPGIITGSKSRAPIPAHAEWKEIAQRKDHFEREANKWRKMYEDEHANTAREAALNNRIEEMRKNEISLHQAIEQMQRKIARSEGNYNTLKQIVESNSTDDKTTQLFGLMESYQELSQQFDALIQQMTAKTQEIQALTQSRAETERVAEERIKQMEEVARRERAAADSARNRMAEMEENHLNLGKAYRDLSERFIRMREQNPSLRTGPAKTATPTTEESSGPQ